MALVAYFPADEGSGAILHDTANGHNLTRSGGDLGWVAGHGDHTYAFSPITNSLPSYPETQAFEWGGATNGGPFSFACWLNRRSTAMGPILAVEQGGVHYLRNGSTYIDLPSGADGLPMETWFHFAFVVTETTYTYYVNGVAIYSGAMSGFTHYLTIQLGAFSDAYMFPGYFNDLYFFDHALTDFEVDQVMNNAWTGTDVDIYESFEVATLATGLTEIDTDGVLSFPNHTQFKSGYYSAQFNNDGAGHDATIRAYPLAITSDHVSVGLWYRTGDGSTIPDYGYGPLVLSMGYMPVTGGGFLNVNDIKDTGDNHRCLRASFRQNDDSWLYTDYNNPANNSWFWITAQYNRNGTSYVRIYDADLVLLADISQPLRDYPCDFISFGGSYGYTTPTYIDGIMIDYTNAAFPLHNWYESATYVEITASLSGSGALTADLNTYIRTTVNMEANLVGAGDITVASVQRLYELPGNTTPADLTLDGMVYDDLSLREAIKVLLAVNAGKSRGGNTNSITFRDINDTKDKVSATVDSNGNRSNVVINKDV